MDWTAVGIAIATIIVGLIGYLLSRKDSQQEKEIDKMKEHIVTLFTKHDNDVAALRDLREQIAGEHYRRPEVDLKFKDVTDSVRDGFTVTNTKIDRLTEAMMTHFANNNGAQTGKWLKP